MKLGRRVPRALVGSAAKLTAADSDVQRRNRMPWQERALAYYDQVGEIRFCSQFYARMLSRVRFFPAEQDDNGKLTEITSGTPVELLDQIQDPGGGRKRLQYDYGRLMFVTGEGVLFGSRLGTDQERWRFLWSDQIKIDERTGTAARKLPGGTLTDERGVGYRLWTPHPRWADWADSPLRPVLDIAEELLLLTAAVRATAVTRLTNGILKVPTQIAPQGDDDQEVNDDPERIPFVDMLLKHISGQIENPGSAEAAVPFYVEGDYDYLDRLEWMKTHDPATDYLERDLRIEAIDRMALALDLPPEALKGLSGANHWTGEQIQRDMWRWHGIPIADQFANDVNDCYLRPALLKADEDPTNITIGYDDSQVVVSPDRTAVADEAMDRVAISFEGYRAFKGIPEEFAPSDEEVALIAGIKMRDPVVAGLEEQAPAVRGPQADPAVNGDTPGTPPAPTRGRVVSREEARTASINGAALMAIRECRAKAGARLRTAAKEARCSECDDAIDGIPNGVVASALSLEMLESMAKRDPIALVRGGTDNFRGCLEEFGIRPQDAEVLCAHLEAYAANTLRDPNTPDLPPGFTSHVEQALEVSDHAVVDSAA